MKAKVLHHSHRTGDLEVQTNSGEIMRWDVVRDGSFPLWDAELKRLESIGERDNEQLHIKWFDDLVGQELYAESLSDSAAHPGLWFAINVEVEGVRNGSN
jgi:hypothetical protein